MVLAARSARFGVAYPQLGTSSDGGLSWPQRLRLRLAAEARLAPLPWPLDVAVLGMGEDAHTASLFPGAPGYARAIATDQRLAWVVPDTAPHARISFTLSALLASRELLLAIAGESKLAVYWQAAAARDEALPISLVLHQDQTPVSVWIG